MTRNDGQLAIIGRDNSALKDVEERIQQLASPRNSDGMIQIPWFVPNGTTTPGGLHDGLVQFQIGKLCL